MEDDDRGIIAGMIFGAVLGGSMVGTIVAANGCNKRSYDSTNDVQSGYVVPSNLEVEFIDLDGDGKRETTLKYEGRRYLLLQNEGQVTLEEYQPRPLTAEKYQPK